MSCAYATRSCTTHGYAHAHALHIPLARSHLVDTHAMHTTRPAILPFHSTMVRILLNMVHIHVYNLHPIHVCKSRDSRNHTCCYSESRVDVTRSGRSRRFNVPSSSFFFTMITATHAHTVRARTHARTHRARMLLYNSDTVCFSSASSDHGQLLPAIEQMGGALETSAAVSMLSWAR